MYLYFHNQEMKFTSNIHSSASCFQMLTKLLTPVKVLNNSCVELEVYSIFSSCISAAFTNTNTPLFRAETPVKVVATATTTVLKQVKGSESGEENTRSVREALQTVVEALTRRLRTALIVHPFISRQNVQVQRMQRGRSAQ